MFVTPIDASNDDPYVCADIVIHGRRQIGTKAVVQGCTPLGAGGDGSTGSSPRRARTASIISATPARLVTPVDITSIPSAARAAASSRRFSSRSISTRSGPSATMAATSGSFVPPTWTIVGCSQKRVHATGTTPHAMSVSVSEGTRLTTRTPASAAEQARLLRVELFLCQRATLQQTLQLLQLTGDIERRSDRGGPIAGVLAPLGLDLGLDQVLHVLWLAHVGEALLAVLAAGLDQQVAGAEHPLEDALVEVDVVDAVERDLDAALGDHPLTEDDPIVGDHE